MEHLLIEPAPAPAAFRGQWRAIELVPNATSPQSFVVGCVVERGSRVQAHRMLCEFAKFECIYGKSGVALLLRGALDAAQTALDSAIEAGTSTPDLERVHPLLRLSAWRAASGSSATAVADRVYSTIVAMAPAKKDKARFEPMPTPTVRAAVNEILKVAMGVDFAKSIEEAGLVQHEGHQLGINIRNSRVVGSVVSAWYASADTIETHLLRHANDIEAARGIWAAERAGMFVMLPSDKTLGEHLDKKTIKEVHSRIDHIDWAATKRNWRLSVRETPEGIAEDVLEFV